MAARRSLGLGSLPGSIQTFYSPYAEAGASTCYVRPTAALSPGAARAEGVVGRGHV
jgi:hypothetical protein